MQISCFFFNFNNLFQLIEKKSQNQNKKTLFKIMQNLFTTRFLFEQIFLLIWHYSF